MARFLNCPRSMLALGIVALIALAALACGSPSTPTEALSLPTATTLLPTPTPGSFPSIWWQEDYWRNADVNEVRATLDEGARPDGGRVYAGVPLQLATSYSRDPAVIELLLDRGADINEVTRRGPVRTPITFAAEHNPNPSITALLLDRGADVNDKGHAGMTPLHYAAKDNHLAIVKLLLDRGAHVNARDFGGWTPLHMAARYSSRPEIIWLLLDRNANFRARTSRGITACNLVEANDVLALTEAYDLLCR